VNILLIAFSSFLLALSGALVPGPLFTITVTESMKRGFRAGPLIITGHGLLEMGLVILIVFRVTPFFTSQAVRIVISLAGGVILVIMGILLLKDARKITLQYAADVRQRGMHPVVAGIVGSVSNPYWMVWWVTIGLGYLVTSLKYGIAGVAAFYLGHISADLLWYSVISYTVSRGRTVIGAKGYRYALYACGVFLILFGGWFLSVSSTFY
jgi:threonine/homoserine/homoserine lactone efflux protein